MIEKQITNLILSHFFNHDLNFKWKMENMNSFLIFKFQDHFNGQNKVQFEQGLLFALLFQQLKMFVELHSHNGNPF